MRSCVRGSEALWEAELEEADRESEREREKRE